MPQGIVRTGAFGYLQYGYERVAFGTEAATKNAVFGLEQRISGWTFTNNKIALSQLNCVHVKTYAYGQTQGSMSIDFVMSNPHFLNGFFDSAVFALGGACVADTMTYTISSKLITTAGIDVGIENSSCAGADVLRKLNGVVFNSASIRSSIGDTVKVSLDTTYASEATTACPTLDCAPAAEAVGIGGCQNIPFTFAHGSLEFPCGTTIAEVQDMDITLSQGSELLWQQGSHVAVDAYRKLFEITGKFTSTFTNQVQLNKVFAQTGLNAQTLASEQPNMILTFTNGLSGDSVRSLVITLTGIGIADHSTGVEPNEPIFEDITWQARTASIVFSGQFADPVALTG